jgi:hypothetical protein
MSNVPVAKVLLDKNKVHFTVTSTDDCKFQYRGKVFEIELPEEVSNGDQVIATINTDTNKGIYVRHINKSGQLRKRKSKRSKRPHSKRRKTRRR